MMGAAVGAALVLLAVLGGIGIYALGDVGSPAKSAPLPLDAEPPPPDAGAQSARASGEASTEVAAEPSVEQALPEPAAPSCPDFSGHWAGRWGASTSRGTWTADFTQRPAEGGGTELHGDIRVRGTACGTGGHIVGRILDDCTVEFDPYRTGPCRVRYQATFEGDRLSGTLAATGFGMADHGSWRGTRRPAAPTEEP